MAQILIVDDDKDILKITQQILESAGHTVFTAQDALAAMDLLNSSPIDLLISDAKMPHFSGFELVQTLTKNKRFEGMAVAMLTGLREKKSIEKAAKAGVHDYIIKPIDPIVFLKKVEDLLKRFPPQERARLDFDSSSHFSAGVIHFPIEVVSLLENGIICRSGQSFQKDMIIEVDTPLFKKLGLEKQPMKVLDSHQISPTEWEVQFCFLTQPEVFGNSLKQWILKEKLKKTG
ncbi:MAG: response regulator [Bdellovibrio sp.]|nr:MAG: response regulator [Bdellovibrio sp.]